MASDNEEGSTAGGAAGAAGAARAAGDAHAAADASAGKKVRDSDSDSDSDAPVAAAAPASKGAPDSDSDSDSDDSGPKVQKKKLLKKKKKKEKEEVNSDSDDDDSDGAASPAAGGSDSDGEPKKGKKKLLKKKGKAAGSPAKKKKKAAPTKVTADNFIASDDDNDSLADEYKNQKEFESDEDPYGDEDNMGEEDEKPAGAGKKLAKVQDDDADPDSFNGLLKQIAARKSAARKKKMGDETKRDRAIELLKRMKEAVIRDNKARSKRKPATHKLAMLDEVELNLLNSELQETLLDCGALKLLGEWLRPSKIDGALPSQTIRTRIIEILPQLQVKVDEHLERPDCELGKVVAYLASNQKETKQNRAILRRRMEVWAQSIFTNRKKRVAVARVRDGIDDDEDDDALIARSTAPKRPRNEERRGREAPKEKFQNLGKLREQKKRAKAAAAAQASSDDRKGTRAMIPQPINFDYAVRPQGSGGKEKSIDGRVKASADKRKELEKMLVAARKKR